MITGIIPIEAVERLTGKPFDAERYLKPGLAQMQEIDRLEAVIASAHRRIAVQRAQLAAIRAEVADVTITTNDE